MLPAIWLLSGSESGPRARVSGRDPGEVKLVGVTKTVPVERIREGIEAGLEVLGENYIQEAMRKKEALAGFSVSWHCIGHLQTNKAKNGH